MSKLPSLQFYPGDWMKDPAVRSVSPAARGLWIDMLCLMHESDRRGYLQHATGKPVTAEQLARMTGCSTDEVSRLLQELRDSGVFSCTEHGIIYSRRMARDEHKRHLCADAGKKGGGNPSFKGQPKGQSKGSRKQNANPSISPSLNTPLTPQEGTVTSEKRSAPINSQFSPEYQSGERILTAFKEITGRDYFRNNTEILERIKDGYTEDRLIDVIRVKINDPYFKEHPEHITPAIFFKSKDAVEHALNVSHVDTSKPKREFLKGKQNGPQIPKLA